MYFSGLANHPILVDFKNEVAQLNRVVSEAFVCKGEAVAFAHQFVDNYLGLSHGIQIPPTADLFFQGLNYFGHFFV
jgi:hypothetical protein